MSVRVENIVRSYAGEAALKGVSFEVDRGEIFGLIGPDGAGKTSLFRILTTLLLPDSGEAWVDGKHIIREYKDIRRSVGYMPGRFSLYQDLTVEENLRLFASIFNTSIEENYSLISDIYSQIQPFKKRKAGALSGGMKQKLALSCALIHKPNVLFLDEPTTGVDPVSRKELWQMLKKLKNEGISVLVSTPYMDEAEQCDRIGLIQDGLLLKVDQPARIRSDYTETLWSVRSEHMYKLLLDLRQIPELYSSFAFGESHHVTVSDPHFTIEDLRGILLKKGHRSPEITPIEAGIEDCFMEMAGR